MNTRVVGKGVSLQREYLTIITLFLRPMRLSQAWRRALLEHFDLPVPSFRFLARSQTRPDDRHCPRKIWDGRKSPKNSEKILKTSVLD